jgi:hypothetical protein
MMKYLKWKLLSPPVLRTAEKSTPGADNSNDSDEVVNGIKKLANSHRAVWCPRT